jgi:hypothetical protein
MRLPEATSSRNVGTNTDEPPAVLIHWMRRCLGMLAGRIAASVPDRCGVTTDALLVAALARADAARVAFQAWQSLADLDHLLPGEFELLPALYQNLTQLALAHPWLDRLRGVCRKAWYIHQLNLDAGLAFSRACDAEGYGQLVLACDAAAVQAGARRPLNVLPLLAPAAHASALLRLARARGWVAVPPSTRTDQAAFVAWRSSVVLQTPGGQRVRLKWACLDEWPDARLDQSIRARASLAEFRLGAHAVLDATAALLLVCAAGATGPGRLPVLADAGLILLGGDAIDWPWLLAAAREAQVAASVLTVLAVLVAELSVAVPAQVLADLRGAPAPEAHVLARHWRRFRRIAAARHLPATVANFVVYLQHTRGLETAGQVLLRAARRMPPR